MGQAGDRRGVPGDWLLLAVVCAALVGGGVAWLAGWPAADPLWATATSIAAVPATWWLLSGLRHGRIGVDVIAVLALVGALIAGEFLAGAVVALMLATGRVLEGYAERRAARDLRVLLSHAPRTARRRSGPADQPNLETVALDDVRVDDLLLVGPGEVVPVDGVLSDAAVLDESVVTGEAQPVHRAPGDRVASGVVNSGAAVGLRAVATPDESTYAGIARLAQAAIEHKAPMVRLADRYAAAFVPFTLVLAGVGWLVSGEFVRSVAVLVVATPCPLILATPIAIVSGLSRAARSGMVVRDGGSLEVLARARTLLVDKTGTLTSGRPQATEVVAGPEFSPDEVVRLAASVEQVSPHVLATAVVRESARRGLSLATPVDVVEDPGTGVRGRIDGRLIGVGQLVGEPPAWASAQRRRAEREGTSMVWVSVDGAPAGALLLTDPVRREARRTVRRLRDAGFDRIVLLTGDRATVAADVARIVGVDDVVARCSPQEKADRVRAESDRAVTVMVGDGVNDAPALAAAGVGVAMGATGATASAEVADAVLTVDRLDRLADTAEIAQRARRIAVQSATVGMGLSMAAMVVAAAGWLAPVAGAFLQEGIDILVIVNALRALRGGVRRVSLSDPARAEMARFSADHERLRDLLTQVRSTADLVAADPDVRNRWPVLRALRDRLANELLPHEDAEETQLYPLLAATLGSAAATATMSRTHVEIHRLVDRVDGHVRQLPDGEPPSGDPPDGGSPDGSRLDLLACLYGLDAVLRLHFAQEEEDFFALDPAGRERSADARAS